MKKQAPTILMKIQKIKRLFLLASYLMENEDLEFAVIAMKGVAARLENLLNELKEQSSHAKAYVDFVEKDSLAGFAEDFKVLQHMNNDLEKNLSFDSGQFQEICAHLNNYLNLVERTVKLMIPPKDWRRFFPKFKGVQTAKILGAAALVLLVFLGSLILVNNFRRQKYSLAGEFYNDGELKDLARRTSDASIDFNWGYGAPFLGFRKDHFSARWTGFIYAPEEGKYLFQTKVDDGARFWIDDNLVINDWASQYWHVSSGTTTLAAGYHKIKLEYMEVDSSAGIVLSWKLPSWKSPAIIDSKFFISQEKYLPTWRSSK